MERYIREKTLSESDMSEVYLAFDQKLNRRVAIKKINSEKINKAYKIRFEREIKILINLEHPNIIPIYDYDISETEIYYVMKYVKGNTLKEMIVGLPIESKVFIFCELLNIFSFIHKNKVVHRDIKPENIIVDEKSGNIYVLDFGISKIDEPELTKLTKSKNYMGTFYYSSPEQFKGEEISIRSDIYSLGVVLYEMICKTLPFDGTVDTIMYAHIHEPPPPIENDVRQELKSICLKMLEKDPNKRYQSCDAIIRELTDNNLIAEVGIFKKSLKEQRFKKIRNLLITFLIIAFTAIFGIYLAFKYSKKRRTAEDKVDILGEIQGSKKIEPKTTQEKQIPNYIKTPENQIKNLNNDKEISKNIRKREKINTQLKPNQEWMHTTTNVNLRQKSDNHSQLLNIVPNGTKIIVEKIDKTEKLIGNEEYNWFYAPNLNAYIYGKYLAPKVSEKNLKNLILRKSNNSWKAITKNIKPKEDDILLYNNTFQYKNSKGKYQIKQSKIVLIYPNEKEEILCFDHKTQYQMCE